MYITAEYERKTMSKLDDILDAVWVETTEGDTPLTVVHPEVKQQIIRLFLDIVGEDEKHGSGQNVAYEAGIDWRNQLKAELRKKIWRATVPERNSN